MKKYLVIHMTKNSQGISTNKVCGVFNFPQDAEAYRDRHDRRMLDSYMVIAELDYDEKGNFVPQDFEYNEDEPWNEKTILKAMGVYSNIPEDVSLEEAFKEEVYPTKHGDALDSSGHNYPFAYSHPAVQEEQKHPEEEILKDDPNGIKDEMKELK